MLKPEDFHNQLDEALADRQKVIQEAVGEKRLNRQERVVRLQQQLDQQTSEDAAKEKERNQAILELDSQLPIRQFLEILRDKIAPKKYLGGFIGPKQPLQKFGPKNGGIAYGLVYKDAWESVVVGHHTVIGQSHNVGHGAYADAFEVNEYATTRVRYVLGVALTTWSGPVMSPEEDRKRMKICTNKVSKYAGYNDMNPLSWPQNNTIQDIFDVFVKQHEAAQQLAQALTEFYVGLKTGQTK